MFNKLPIFSFSCQGKRGYFGNFAYLGRLGEEICVLIYLKKIKKKKKKERRRRGKKNWGGVRWSPREGDESSKCGQKQCTVIQTISALTWKVPTLDSRPYSIPVGLGQVLHFSRSYFLHWSNWN